MLHRVFVYGSLKSGLMHHDQMAGARLLGAATLPGYVLVLYEEGYPALVEDEPARDGRRVSEVQGELYEVSEAHLLRLDVFEDCPTLYQRSLVSLRGGVQAHAYVVSRRVGARLPRLGGHWGGRATD